MPGAPRTDPDERSLAHPVLISDKWRSKRTAGPHTRPPLGHAQSRSESGTCQMEKCSPRSAAFPPHSPPTLSCLCSNDSSVLCRGVTPQRRACGPCGLSLRPPTCCRTGVRCLRGLPVLGHEVSRRVWGLRLRRTEQGARTIAPAHIAFRAFQRRRRPDQIFSKLIRPPRLYPCLRFAVHLAVPNAKLEAKWIASPFS